MSPAIRIENLSKRYIVSHEGKPNGYKTLRESLVDMASAPLRRLRGEAQATTEEFWALKDINVDIQPGEVVGIIGRNGAGKSTLLKILSRITKPTKGRVAINGRVGSLLEVGTGFHPELTGRENIFLNGSILGMSQKEIQSKFDEIVEFAEVAKFLDTPVKRYSSGMYVRLAFAVAAHLEPEILIIDEVLAVGDSHFQRRCLGKMQDVASTGRTVIFVSHNMTAVENLCDRVVLLQRGGVKQIGAFEDVVPHYYDAQDTIDSDSVSSARSPGMTPTITDVSVVGNEGQVGSSLVSGGKCSFRIKYKSKTPIVQPRFSVVFETLTGQRLFIAQTGLQVPALEDFESCEGSIECEMPELRIIPGTYAVTVGCASAGNQLDLLERVALLDVVSRDFYGTGRLPEASLGHFLVDAKWSHSEAFKSGKIS